MDIPFNAVGSGEVWCHFLHANGYPPLAYRNLLTLLSQKSQVVAMHLRPLWPGSDPQALLDWRLLADDLTQFLDDHHLNHLVGIGHSVGGVTTLRLALRQPERFSRLVLIDPVLFPPRMIHFWRLVYYLGLAEILHPLVRGAKRRRMVFESRQAMFDNYRRKAVFSKISDEGLQDYVEALAHSCTDGQVELAYPPQWEARIYVTGLLADLELWRKLPTLKPPLLIIRGSETNTFWVETGRLVQRCLPQAQVVTLPEASHLVPLEKPLQVYDTIDAFFKN
ncbi:MAG: alpha/beta hydrolase [Anaerolineales bacterium]|nr:alpha/beta hydrolase [Anaerolineales bacterium]